MRDHCVSKHLWVLISCISGNYHQLEYTIKGCNKGFNSKRARVSRRCQSTRVSQRDLSACIAIHSPVWRFLWHADEDGSTTCSCTGYTPLTTDAPRRALHVLHLMRVYIDHAVLLLNEHHTRCYMSPNAGLIITTMHEHAHCLVEYSSTARQLNSHSCSKNMNPESRRRSDNTCLSTVHDFPTAWYQRPTPARKH